MTARARGSRARVAGLALLCALAALPAAAAPSLTVTPEGVRWHGVRLSGRPLAGVAPVEAWWAATADTGLVGLAVRTALADTLVARGDTLRADTLLAAPRLARSLWGWDALRRRVTWALARGELARAARLLDDADHLHWLASEEAAWRATAAPVLVTMRDTLGGEALARSVLETYVGVTPASAQALALLDTLARARREPFAPRLGRRAARAEWANGRRDAALARLFAISRGAAADERGADALLRTQWLREARRPQAAIAASDTAIRWNAGTPAADQARLERARALRDAGRTDSALAAYARLGRTASEPLMRVTAWWEGGREAQDESRWAVAAQAFRAADSVSRLSHEGRALVQAAPALAGLMDWMLGRHDRAIAAWRGAGSDRRARFWLGIALRQRREAEGDSILREEFARKPGYDLYCAAARDTLGLPSWPGHVLAPEPDTLEPQLVAAVVALSGPLALPEAAARLVSARDRRDPRLPGGRGIAASSWRAIAVASYAGGDLAGATRAAERALLAPAPDSVAWGWNPWAFPPAYERELAAAADSVRIERALLWALARQESRFDPRAVSRSNALGLTQLLPGTARDVARMLKETLRADSLMFEPARGMRYGARYLRLLLDRFDGNIPVALTAYNAGPGRVRRDWREILAHGGWALYCEMAANADTQDYVRRILGFRQAYRELRPAGEAP